MCIRDSDHTAHLCAVHQNLPKALPCNIAVADAQHQRVDNGDGRAFRGGEPVSYTHLDVYKRQKVDSRFYCFGCGASGDVIDFAALLHGLGKREAAVRLAEDRCV